MPTLLLTPQERMMIRRRLAHRYQECIRKGHKGGAKILQEIIIKLG